MAIVNSLFVRIAWIFPIIVSHESCRPRRRAQKIGGWSWTTDYKDKRADPRGQVPGAVWHFPRVCGTFKERRGGRP